MDNLGDLLKDTRVPNFSGPDANIGAVLSGLLNIVFYIAIFLTFYWIIWGVFQYILASGKKEELAKARGRITWALIGLLIVISAYLMITFAGEVFPSKGGLPF